MIHSFKLSPQGCRLLRTDSVRSLKSSLEQLVKEVENNEAFSDVYRYAFRFALDVECGQRSLPVDVAVSLWRLVFTHRPVPLLDRWIEFLEQTPPPVRAIPRYERNTFESFYPVTNPLYFIGIHGACFFIQWTLLVMICPDMTTRKLGLAFLTISSNGPTIEPTKMCCTPRKIYTDGDPQILSLFSRFVVLSLALLALNRFS